MAIKEELICPHGALRSHWRALTRRRSQAMAVALVKNANVAQHVSLPIVALPAPGWQSRTAKELRLMLGKAAVADLAVTEEVLEHMEGVFDPGANLHIERFLN